MTTAEKPATRKMPNRALPVKKNGSFAIGVSTVHYWVITAMAAARNTNRSAILEEILAKHLDQTLGTVKE